MREQNSPEKLSIHLSEMQLEIDTQILGEGRFHSNTTAFDSWE